VSKLADRIFNFLEAKEGFTLPTGIRVVLCRRNSGGPLGQDQNDRWEHSDNYYLTLWRPSENRI
jgi:hypothetical protein